MSWNLRGRDGKYRNDRRATKMASIEERSGVESRWRVGSVEALAEEGSRNGGLGRMPLQLLQLPLDICDIHVTTEPTRTPSWPEAGRLRHNGSSGI
jgi:hypothetical protein